MDESGDISFILDYVDDNVLASQALVYLQRGWEQSRWLRRSSIKMALVRLVSNNNNNDYAIKHWGLLAFIYVGLKRFPSQNWVEKYFATIKVTYLLPRKKCVCIPHICHFFTQAKFLENKIYTEKRVNYDKIHRKLPTFALLRQNTQ